MKALEVNSDPSPYETQKQTKQALCLINVDQNLQLNLKTEQVPTVMHKEL